MPHFLSQEELQRTAPAETAAFASPVPTQIVSNGEFNPLPQTREQERVEARIKDLAKRLAPVHGMDRRRFLASTGGHGCGVPRHERSLRPRFRRVPRRGADAGRRRPARGCARRPVHLRRSGALRAGRFQPDRPPRPREVRPPELESRAGRRQQPRPLQVRELRQGDLRRQRYQGGAPLGRALR